jgi:hypothetical protein
MWHPDIVEELLWLHLAWLAAHRPDAASSAVGDWHDRQRPGVVRRVNGYASACSLGAHRPGGDRHTPILPTVTDAAAAIAGWWATNRRPARAGTHRGATGRRRRPSDAATPMNSTDDSSRAGRRAVWIAALLVASGAGVATAHGLYRVAAGAGVPLAVAWLYPLITDGLALVAYAATARLQRRPCRYAAGIVIAAAGLSGLAQAVYLAGALDRTGPAPIGLRFGVGAWPAVAAALTAHLLHLISSGHRQTRDAESGEPSRRTPAAPYNPPFNAVVQPRSPADTAPAVQALAESALNTSHEPLPMRGAVSGGGSARERARTAAQHHHDRHGGWPTVTELMGLAEVARGTAGTALKDLRNERPALHVVNAETENGTN